ncbi:MAG TPA: DinB family protein [Ktedonobacteraceae bacterium]|nr:DinB family protein [Ktedonobacteraceae bacterium]
MPTREMILKTLAEAHEELLAYYRALTPEELESICTTSEVPGGEPWRPKDHLAHLTFIEQAFQGMVRRVLKGSADPVGFSRTGATNREEILAWIHCNNQAYVDVHRSDSLETLLTDLAHARQQTLALLEQMTDEQLSLPLPGAPWDDGTAGGILITNAHHEQQHLSWVQQGLHQHS